MNTYRFVAISHYGDHTDMQGLTEAQARSRFNAACISKYCLYAAYFETCEDEPVNQFCKYAGS